MLSQATRLVAVMLGLLRMKVDQAIDELLAIAPAVFRNAPQGTIDRDENSRRLKLAVEGMIEAEEVSLDTKMHEPMRPPGRCKVLVYPQHLMSQLIF